MDLGKKIKENRLRCNLTQEHLAEQLNVTAQAVSKWESNASMPDIMLLPELSSIFGITIDDLFDASEETHLRRIENMLEKETMLSRNDFDYAQTQLKEGLHNPSIKARCLSLLADLHLHRADGYADIASEYAKQALSLEPCKKDNHCILNKSAHGVLQDWCVSNHTPLIEYYKAFVAKNPDYLSGYLWLMDNLIADYRLEEAQSFLEKMRSVEETYHYLLYKGWITFASGDTVGAEAIWKEMTDQYSDNWFAWCARANAYAKHAKYDEAIQMYRKAVKLQTTPRYTDNEDSIAQLCMLKGDYQGAINAYEEVISILENDWHITEGETLEGYHENIAQCKALLKND